MEMPDLSRGVTTYRCRLERGSRERLVFAVCCCHVVHTACVYKSLSPARSIFLWLVEPKAA